MKKEGRREGDAITREQFNWARIERQTDQARKRGPQKRGAQQGKSDKNTVESPTPKKKDGGGGGGVKMKGGGAQKKKIKCRQGLSSLTTWGGLGGFLAGGGGRSAEYLV